MNEQQEVLTSYFEQLTELHDLGNKHVKELILTGIEELIQSVKSTNTKTWDDDDDWIYSTQ